MPVCKFTPLNMLNNNLPRYLYFPRILGSCVRYEIDSMNLKKNTASNATTDLKLNESIKGNGKRKSTAAKLTVPTTVTKRPSANVVEPAMDCQRRKEIQNVVGIHMGPTSLYWAKIARNGDVLEWKYLNIFPSSKTGKKMLLPKIFAMMDCVSENIPFSDIFVLEASNSKLSSVSSPAVIANALLRSQMIAVLLTILNLRLENENSEEYYHKVFILKQRTVSRFFNLLVGQERVSALSLVDLILGDGDSLPSPSISEIMNESKVDGVSTPREDASTMHSQPLYTPIKAPASIVASFYALEAVERESMSQALLIAMAFYDLVVFKDPKGLPPLQE